MSWVIAFIGFAMLIMLHELGHMLVAKAVGMRVERYCLFFPPLIVKKQWGETEYGIGAIPLGGYVKITGMSPKEEIPPEWESQAFYRQKVWKRVAVIAAGPAVNIVLAFIIFWALFWGNGNTVASTKVASVSKGSPAAAVLKPGDRLISVDGIKGNEQTLGNAIASHHCAGRPTPNCKAMKPVKIVVQRGNKLLDFTVRPYYDPTAMKTRLGFTFGTDQQPIGPLDAASQTGTLMWDVTSGTVTRIVSLFEEKSRKQVTGVVGAFEYTRQAIDLNFTAAMRIIALFSLSLGIINLFPFVPLDGGHIFWALAEKGWRRPIPYSIIERAGIVGFVLVIALFVIGLSNDIGRLAGPGFHLQ